MTYILIEIDRVRAENDIFRKELLVWRFKYSEFSPFEHKLENLCCKLVLANIEIESLREIINV